MRETQTESLKPYFMAGAGRLASTVWKETSEHEVRYCFNLFVLDASNGSTDSRFLAQDLVDLRRLIGVLASELTFDGCMSESLRQQLQTLATELSEDSTDMV